MNKTDLAKAMVKETGVSQAEAKRAIESILGIVISALKKGEKVRLLGFGTFSVSTRSARMGRNSNTRHDLTDSARKRVKFKPVSDLIDTDDTGPMKSG